MTIKERLEELQLIVDNSLIEIDFLNEVLKDTHEDNVNFILEVVSLGENISVFEIKSKSRKQEVVTARIMCAGLLRDFTTLSLKQIGLILGYRHHASIIHSIQTLTDFLKTKDFSVKDYETYRKRVQNRQDSIIATKRKFDRESVTAI